MRPFGCPVTILNTLDSLGKFDGKVDEIFLVRYFVSSKAFRVFNSRTQIIQETLHVNFLENKPNIVEKAWEESDQQYVLFPVWSSGSTNPHNTDGDATFDEKEPEFDAKKPESEVNVSLSSRNDESLPPSPIYDRYQSGNGYHAVPPLYTGTFMPPKPNLVFNNAHTAVETDHSAFTVKLTVVTQSKPVSITAARPVSTDVPRIKATGPKHAKPIVAKTKSPNRRHINRSPSPKASNSPPRVTAVKALMVNAAQGMQGRWEWKPKFLVLDHVSRNTSASITLKRFDYNDALGRS
nr:retrovirus-related Pol polyprotein from transposon TNT 1-94 [Tanacetum cinerariifolium]